MTDRIIRADRTNSSALPRIRTRAMMTIGVAALGIEAMKAATTAIEVFDEFLLLHRPEEHVREGFITICGQEVFFKFEYCDDGMCVISERPDHPEITQRVVSFILAQEP